MEWVKVYTDLRSSKTLNAIHEAHGLKGIGAWFNLLCIMAGGFKAPDFKTSWQGTVALLSGLLGCHPHFTRRFLDTLLKHYSRVTQELPKTYPQGNVEVTGIVIEWVTPQVVKIDWPNIATIADNYTKRQLKVYEHMSDKSSDKCSSRTEQNREEVKNIYTDLGLSLKEKAKNKKTAKKKNTKLEDTPEFLEWFEEKIWLPYPKPKRGAKKSTMIRIRKILESGKSTKAELEESVQHQISYADRKVEKEGPDALQFINNAEVFFNPDEERWLEMTERVQAERHRRLSDRELDARKLVEKSRTASNDGGFTRVKGV